MRWPKRRRRPCWDVSVSRGSYDFCSAYMLYILVIAMNKFNKGIELQSCKIKQCVLQLHAVWSSFTTYTETNVNENKCVVCFFTSCSSSWGFVFVCLFVAIIINNIIYNKLASININRVNTILINNFKYFFKGFL